MSTWASIVARVVSVMSGITDIGNVYGQSKISDTAKRFWQIVTASPSDAGTTNQKIGRSWQVMLGNPAMDTRPEDSGGTMQWDRLVVIEGFFEMPNGNDSTAEATALNYAEQVIKALWTDVRTTRLNNTILFGKPAKLVAAHPTLLPFCLAFYVRLTMVLTTIEQ